MNDPVMVNEGRGRKGEWSIEVKSPTSGEAHGKTGDCETPDDMKIWE